SFCFSFNCKPYSESLTLWFGPCCPGAYGRFSNSLPVPDNEIPRRRDFFQVDPVKRAIIDSSLMIYLYANNIIRGSYFYGYVIQSVFTSYHWLHNTSQPLIT